MLAGEIILGKVGSSKRGSCYRYVSKSTAWGPTFAFTGKVGSGVSATATIFVSGHFSEAVKLWLGAEKINCFASTSAMHTNKEVGNEGLTKMVKVTFLKKENMLKFKILFINVANSRTLPQTGHRAQGQAPNPVTVVKED